MGAFLIVAIGILGHVWGEIPVSVAKKTKSEVFAELIDYASTYAISLGNANDIASRTFKHKLFYGSKSKFAKMNQSQKQMALNDLSPKGQSPFKAEHLTPSSCIDFALLVLKEAYHLAGQAKSWGRIENYVMSHQGRGTSLLAALKQNGWEIVYFNRDTNWSPPQIDHSKGRLDTLAEWNMAKNRRALYQVPIDHFFINFAPQENTNTPIINEGMNRLKEVPFWVAIGSGGFHVFLGHQERVVHMGVSAEPNSTNNVRLETFMEITAFHRYPTGLIAIPPNSWHYR